MCLYRYLTIGHFLQNKRHVPNHIAIGNVFVLSCCAQVVDNIDCQWHSQYFLFLAGFQASHGQMGFQARGNDAGAASPQLAPENKKVEIVEGAAD